jgi:hypothetical protein
MTGNLVANISRRTLLLASCSLAGAPERSYAQPRAMIHIILLGDSVFDNAAYVSRDPDVLRQLEQMLPQGRKATLLARDGAVISEVGNQLRGLPSDARRQADLLQFVCGLDKGFNFPEHFKFLFQFRRKVLG